MYNPEGIPTPVVYKVLGCFSCFSATSKQDSQCVVTVGHVENMTTPSSEQKIQEVVFALAKLIAVMV